MLTSKSDLSTKYSMAFEWPTLAVIVLSYLSYAFITTILASSTPIGATAVLAFVIALHSSLQHEVLHGHPCRRQWQSDLLVFPALGLFIPYERFRDTHLAHHRDPKLTDPFDDPESNYLAPEDWARCSGLSKAVLRFNNKLLGRMLIGPLLGLSAFWKGDIRLIMQGEKTVIRAYLLHALGLVPVIGWMAYASTLPVWLYLIAAYVGLSILKVRTFLEHRAHETLQGRSVIIEDRGLLAFLFLNNNYHSVHHAYPGIPWYALPRFYAARREAFLRRNRGYVYATYGEIFRKYFFRRKDPVPHPLMTGDASIPAARKDA